MEGGSGRVGAAESSTGAAAGRAGGADAGAGAGAGAISGDAAAGAAAGATGAAGAAAGAAGGGGPPSRRTGRVRVGSALACWRAGWRNEIVYSLPRTVTSHELSPRR